MDRSDYQKPEEMILLAMADDYDPEKDGILEPHNEYLLRFKIIFNTFELYSKANKELYDNIFEYKILINYENNDNEKTICFSSDFIQEYRNDKFGNKLIDTILHYGDIRNVFFCNELNIEFKNYINHIIITLRKILYKAKYGT